ncbi:MAG: sigma-70 family RNA polymerase sigma factor [Verrucomicrobiota bacterium]|nr:sigma-70 family RNA polymerase sigma factor [Verrucomicrobiota bacterium]
MTDAPDARLLEQFTRNGSEEAFAALVQRHIGLVHSVALRHTASSQHAEDITQAVFIILARKAKALGRRTVLPGWLYHTARLTAANWQRAETRRVRREQEAFMQSTFEEPATDALWQKMRPQLDSAMAVLSAGERDALVLRYFQNQSMAEVGQLLGLAENTAQKRIGRALEKLRKFLFKRGVKSTAAAIGETISVNSVQVAPAVLAKSVTAAALAKGAAASTSTLTLIKGALKIMAWTKAKTVVIAGLSVVLAATTATFTVKEIHERESYSWRTLSSFRPPWSFAKMPQEVEIFPAKFPKRGSRYAGEAGNDGRFIGLSVPVQIIIEHAFHFQHPDRIIYPSSLHYANYDSAPKYDFIATLPHGSGEALQQELRKSLGLAGRFEMIETNALLLKVKYPNAAGLVPSTSKLGSMNVNNGEISAVDGSIDNLAQSLEDNYFEIPILGQTGLTKRYNYKISWDDLQGGFPNLNGLKQALLDQLGLELVPTNMPIQMLVVEKAK